MEYINLFLDVLKNKYALFSGRARRKEFWGFTLVYVVIYIILSVIDGIVFVNLLGIPVLSYLFMLAILVPSIAITVRRLHDTDRSGWWALLMIVPLLSLVLLVFMVLEGQQNENQYGEDPKALPAT